MSAETGPRAIEEYLHRRIPIAAAMGVRVESADPLRVRLSAPFGPNVNTEESGRHEPGAAREVVFGGSAAAVAILAAWTLLYVRDRAAGGRARLVIQRAAIDYQRPITGAFEALCELEDEAAYRRFRNAFERRGRGRITLRSTLLQGGRRAGSFEGDFVALRSE